MPVPLGPLVTVYNISRGFKASNVEKGAFRVHSLVTGLITLIQTLCY